MKTSEAKIQANARWNKKALERFSVTVRKGEKTPIVEHARSRGESINGFIVRAIRETIERDKAGS